jgi:hypothetical protein
MPPMAVLCDPDRTVIQAHPCPKCAGPMVLTSIKPSGPGFERRMFQGVHCGHVDKMVTENASMKWISSSGLREPT